MQLTAIATFILAFIAAASIVVTLIIQAKYIKENRRIQNEDRNLKFKLKLLDEVRDWAWEAVRLGFLYERARVKPEMRQIFENMIEAIAQTADVVDMASKIFKNELEAPVTKAMSFTKSFQDPDKFASQEYFDALHELLKAINRAKRKLLES